MSVAQDVPDITLADEIACVRRELAMRRSVYDRWVSKGRMNARQAQREIRLMEAVLRRLEATQGRLL